MYVNAAAIRSKVAVATGEGWNCTGVCYGVPDLGERVIEDMPRTGPLAGFGTGGRLDAQEAGFPVGVVAVICVLILGGFVLSFFVKQSPAGKWRFER